MRMRVLVCGGRDFNDYERLKKALDGLEITTIISGLAKGADTLAVLYAHSKKISVLGFPAKWRLYGKSAGFVRNRQMLEEGKSDLVVAFPGGAGTDMMRKLTVQAGIKLVMG